MKFPPQPDFLGILKTGGRPTSEEVPGPKLIKRLEELRSAGANDPHILERVRGHNGLWRIYWSWK